MSTETPNPETTTPDTTALETIRDAQIAHAASCDTQHGEAKEERKELRACVHRIEGQCGLIIAALHDTQRDNGTQDARLSSLEAVRKEGASAGKASGATAGAGVAGLVTLITYLVQMFAK